MKKVDKILQYIDDQKIDVAEFERKSGISNGYLNNTRKRGADITQKILDKIRETSIEMYNIAMKAIGEPEQSTEDVKIIEVANYRDKYEVLLEKVANSGTMDVRDRLDRMNEDVRAMLAVVRSLSKEIESLHSLAQGRIVADLQRSGTKSNRGIKNKD